MSVDGMKKPFLARSAFAALLVAGGVNIAGYGLYAFLGPLRLVPEVALLVATVGAVSFNFRDLWPHRDAR